MFLVGTGEKIVFAIKRDWCRLLRKWQKDLSVIFVGGEARFAHFIFKSAVLFAE